MALTIKVSRWLIDDEMLLMNRKLTRIVSLLIWQNFHPAGSSALGMIRLPCASSGRCAHARIHT
eukprot:7094539-Pyramimonas_sp.AAC.2